MDHPLVTCIIPTYNRSELVKYSIDSVLAQTYSPIEIIVIDDGSTDNTLQELQKYGDKITVIAQKNAGSSAARNVGLAIAKGEYIGWLDSDDAWMPQKIAAQMDAFEIFPDAGVIATLCRDMDKDGLPLPGSDPIAIAAPRLKSNALAILIVDSDLMPSSLLVRRSVLDDLGSFDSERIFAEDWELNFRIALKYPIVEIPSPLTRIRIHESRKTADLFPHALGALEIRKRIESERQTLLANDTTGEIAAAYKRHDKKFAEAYYRLGKQYAIRGDIKLAREMLSSARQKYPFKLKYFTKSLGLAFKR